MNYLYIKKIFTDVYSKIENGRSNSKSDNAQAIIISISAAILLATVNFYACIGHSGNLMVANLIILILNKIGIVNIDSDLIYHISWSLLVIALWLLVPACLIKFVFRKSLRDYGFTLNGIMQDIPLYLLFGCFVIPVVMYASTFTAMRSIFPFYHINSSIQLKLLIIWEVFYCIQFIAVEFFFRGFLIHGLKKTLGYNVIYVVAIPYCMIHFNKTFVESIGAIITGIVLGNFSLKRNSIILGCVIQCVVAITMDASVVFALLHH